MTKMPPQEPVQQAEHDEPLPDPNQLKIELVEGASPGEKILVLTVFSPQGVELTERIHLRNAALINKDNEVY